ncbi:hypothetical protein D3C87_1386300 [compost metagenome]
MLEGLRIHGRDHLGHEGGDEGLLLGAELLDGVAREREDPEGRLARDQGNEEQGGEAPVGDLGGHREAVIAVRVLHEHRLALEGQVLEEGELVAPGGRELGHGSADGDEGRAVHAEHAHGGVVDEAPARLVVAQGEDVPRQAR